MPKNFSQKGFAEIISLIAVAFMLVTIPVAKQLADKRQELRKLAQEADCSVTDKCAGTDDPSQCYKWAGSGCDWNGPLQPEQGECYCKLSRVSASQQQAQQQASSSQTTCDNANYSWCKDGIRYYCNENKSLTPISQKWQEGNSCYVCGAAAREPVSLSECSSDITNQCGEKNNGDAWCEGTTIVQCVRDPSGYLVKNITSTPCSGAQTTTTSEKPAAPTTITTPEYSQGPCGGNDGRCRYNTICMCKLVNGLWTVAENSKQTGFDACCSRTVTAQAPAQPAAPTDQTLPAGAGKNPCYALPDNETTTVSDGKTVCCSSGTVIACPAAPAQTSECRTFTCINKTAQGETKKYYVLFDSSEKYYMYSDEKCKEPIYNFFNGYCPPDPPVPTTDFTGYKCDGLTLNRYENGKFISSQDCGSPDLCDEQKGCKPAPAQPAAQVEPSVCERANCKSIDSNFLNKDYFTKKGPDDTYKTYSPPDCSNEIDIYTYCAPPKSRKETEDKPILCQTTNCKGVTGGKSNKVFYQKCPPNETCVTYELPNCEKEITENIYDYCNPPIDESALQPAINPCESVADGTPVITNKDECWTCQNGQPTQMDNDEPCKPAKKPAVTQPKPPAAKPERSLTFIERVNNAFCITPPINLFCQLLGYVPYQ